MKFLGKYYVDPNIPPVATATVAPIAADTQEARDFWLQRAGDRKPPRARDVLTLRNWLATRNARKYRQLHELMRWAEDELSNEFGMLPEDARWVLP